MDHIHDLIRQHDRLKNDAEKVRAARRVSTAFVEMGGCGWCWSELHPQARCKAIKMTPVSN